MAVQYRAYKYLEEVDETGIGTDNHFGECNLREVNKVCSSMFNDMCRVYGYDHPQKLTPEVLNKNTVVKAQMAEWLCTAIHLLDPGPLLFAANVICEKNNRKFAGREDL